MCSKREGILTHSGHLLVTGGPGSGKTTIALLKAQSVMKDLRPGQQILFLSFSRAAVRQVLSRCKTILSRSERQAVEVQTYHSFCMEVLKAHGRLLNGITPRFVYPDVERLQGADFGNGWTNECERRAREQALYLFSQFAGATATLFTQCASLRELYAAKYPLMILDEFQDTDNDQWRMVSALASKTHLFCLADPDQSIFQYDPNVDPLRLEKARAFLSPLEFDFEGENHRSPNGGILAFANAVLRNQPLPPSSPDVLHLQYWPKAFEGTAHAATIWLFSELKRQGVADPTIAILCRSNGLVAKLSAAFGKEHVYNGQRLGPIDHQVIWDAELSAASATVLASILEWSAKEGNAALIRTMRSMATYYRLKNASDPTKKAQSCVDAYNKAAEVFSAGRLPNNKVAKTLRAAYDAGVSIAGDPVHDWRVCLSILDRVAGLEEIAKQVRMVRLFRATDALGTGLANLWLSGGSYRTATVLVKRVLDQERLISLEDEPRGCLLMNIHKSKGKEFDGVVLVEGAFESLFYDYGREAPPYIQSRRLLRVGITRARARVVLVRFAKAKPLVG